MKKFEVMKQKTKKKISNALMGRKYPERTGINSSRWKGGSRIDKAGYVVIRSTNHPNVRTDGYVYEHRLIMEKHLGRFLEPFEFVHHKNGIKNDNRIENLDIVFRKKHLGNVRCPYCLKHFLID
jgi:hypothetical protein